VRLIHVTLRPGIGWVAMGPRLRAAPLPMALAGPVLGLLVLLCASWFDATDMTAPLTGGALLTGCTLGYALDDPAADTLACSPVTLLARRLLVVGPVAMVMVAVWWVELELAQQLGSVDPALADRATIMVLAAASVALGLSALGAAKVDSTAGGTLGLLGVIGLMSVLFMAGPIAPDAWRLPSLLPDPNPERWWWLTAAALFTFAWYSRDPARRARRWA
jgi:hypothetical protein